MTEKIRKEYLAAIQDFCLMDDIFFSRCFDGNIVCAQYILRIILDKQDLIVKTAESQYTLENIRGRAVRLDAFAEDSTGKLYNIEVQRKDDGALPQRARYNSSMLDAHSMDKGAEFKTLPETFVIFITENDVLRGGKQIYHIERVIKETAQPFDDGSKIIYVNGKIRGGNLLGDLMHDFFCKDPAAMKHRTLANRVDFVKNNEQEWYVMSDFIERIMAEGRAEGRAEGLAEGQQNLLSAIRNLMANLKLSAEAAMNTLGIAPELQKELAPRI